MTTPLKVLLVEDEAIIAMRMEMELESRGYTVCQSVSNGEDAIKSAEAHHPDVVLMDIRLAGRMDGIEASQRILAIQPVSIIFMSGYADEAVKARAMELSPLGYLEKPINMDRLASTIQSAAG